MSGLGSTKNGPASSFSEFFGWDRVRRASLYVLIQVTGANQGIGLEIVRQLCKKFDGKVILSGTHTLMQLISATMNRVLYRLVAMTDTST